MVENNSGIDLFKRLTQLFRAGPSVKRKVRTYKNVEKATTAIDVFKKAYNQVYSNALNAYGSYDRMARYADFAEMNYTPEISSAIDIYAEEATSVDDKGNVVNIYTENEKIYDLLSELLYDVINVNYNLTTWVRSLCQYGDLFVFINVHAELGVVNMFPMPVNEVEREEGWNPDDPLATRFRWVTQGNKVLEPWQVAHFRLTTNDAFLPYGSSILEPARRIWRQLILIEDAMLVYRVVRSPERRVFFIDVGSVPTEEIPNFMEQAKTKLKRSPVIDKQSGRVDLRYNPLSVDEDYFIPVRGDSTGTKIDTLAGGTHVSDIADVEYIQKKLFAALKVPRAYLGYDEALSSKSTLSQQDIRFSRTINWIQRVIISELEKVCMIHLYAHGFEGEDLGDFRLMLSNPSSVAQMQKLELWRMKFEIAAAADTKLVDNNFLRKEILRLSDYEIEKIKEGKVKDQIENMQIEAAELEDVGPGSFGGSSSPLGGLSSGDIGDIGIDIEEPDISSSTETSEEPTPAAGGEEDVEKPNLFASNDVVGNELLTSSEKKINKTPERKGTDLNDIASFNDDIAIVNSVSNKNNHSMKKTPVNDTQLSKYLYKRSRLRHHGASVTSMPDHLGIVTNDTNDLIRPGRRFDNTIGSSFKESFDAQNVLNKTRVSKQMKDMLHLLNEHIIRTVGKRKQDVLTESLENIDISDKDDLDVILEEIEDNRDNILSEAFNGEFKSET